MVLRLQSCAIHSGMLMLGRQNCVMQEDVMAAAAHLASKTVLRALLL